MSNNLTMTSPTYAAAKFATGLASGSGATSAYPGGTVYTFECWFKTTYSGSNQVLFSIDGDFTGLDNTGKLFGRGAPSSTTATYNDGVFHHLALSSDGTTLRTFVDGVLVASVATAAYGTAKTLTIATHQGFGYSWNGLIDEFAIFSTARYTAAFTPPTAAYANSTTGLYSLYHFDGDGTDSTLAAGTAPNAPTIGTVTAGSGQVSVAFTAASSGSAATGFTATWTPSTGSTVTASGTSSPIVITGLTNGVAGTAHVVATNASGSSVASAESNSVTPTAAAAGVTMAVTDTKVLWAPYVWDTFSGYKQTTLPSAYCKFIFNGTSISVGVDVSPLVAAGLDPSNYPRVRMVVDGSKNTDVQLTPTTTSVGVSGLADIGHAFEFYLDATGDNSGEFWNGPSNCLRVTGFTIDASRTFVAWNATLPDNLLWFGDSISRGYLSLNNGTVMPAANSAAVAIPTIFAAAFQCELGSVSYSGQGYETAAGNTPSFLNAWSYYSNGRSRLVGGLLSPAPKYIAIYHGTNGTTTSADVQSISTQLLSAAPNAKIFHIVPASGTAAAAIRAGVTAAANPKVILVDTNGAYGTGISNYGSGSNLFSEDGLHPDALSNSRAGAGIVRAAQAALDGVTSPTLTSRTVTVTLGTDANTAAANLTGLKVSYFDEASPDLHTVARYKSSAGTTNASGVLSFTAQSTLASGSSGYLVVQGASGLHYNGTVVVS